MNEIEQLQSSVSIADVISKYRPLVKAGKNFKALCPFHDDHSPSLLVNIEQNFAWCFACQNGGNSFVVVQKIEGCSFPEAVKIVGEIGGVDTSFLSKVDPKKHKEQKEHSERIRDVVIETQFFFRDQFDKNVAAQEYIKDVRKMSENIISKFEIGYAPKSFTQLRDYLLSKGFSRKEMVEAGVVSQKEGGTDVIDKFRSRITFPIKNPLGKICGFGARILGDGDPKYLNSPETILYDKSKNLFGFFEAKESMRKKNMVILVEGNLDVMTCHQYGIENVVAISGVGFSIEQAKLIKRFSTQSLLALDSDDAGISATQRIVPTLLSENLSVLLLEISEGKDPDEALQLNKDLFISDIANAKNAVESLLLKWVRFTPPTTPENKRKILQKLFPLLASIPRKMEQLDSLHISANILQMDEVLLQDEFSQYQQKSFQKQSYKNKQKNTLNATKKNSELSKKTYFWGVILKFFPECAKVFELIEPCFFSIPHEKELYSFLLHAYNEGAKVSMREKFLTLPEQFKEEVMKSMLFVDQSLGTLSAKQRKPYIENLIKLIGNDFIKTMKKEIMENPTSENLKNFQRFPELLNRFT